MPTIIFASPKGGAGKSTSAAADLCRQTPQEECAPLRIFIRRAASSL